MLQGEARTWPGRPHPLGATWDGEGVNFALFSAHATEVELCLFERPGDEHEALRLPLQECTAGVWHGFVPGLAPGQAYGWRVHGPAEPHHGHRFDPSRLLLDPHARAITEGPPASPWQGVVTDPTFPWENDRAPATPWNRTVIYECHVKGMTARHPDVPPRLRGTYLGLATEPVIEHLLSLGVTAVELLPVQQSAPERHLQERGLTNYWGYSPLGFFAPHAAYATGSMGEQVQEFKSMVKLFHRQGIEVILDVCYGHTCEGGGGPVLSFAGIDNTTYYRLRRDPSRHVDWTGCGNTLDLSRSRTLQLVLDSLRYWVSEMHVDGFRFDQATVLGRGRSAFDPEGPFLATVAQDPVLAAVKQIAEPWDLGPHGYQLGGFPAGWSEWNDRYRDGVRSFWRGEPGTLSALTTRLAGSSDVFGPSGRGPRASVNFVTCHDGFTLEDLVSYDRKHNEANGERNRDGHDDNRSRNWGVEGPTDDGRVLRRRERVKRALLATLAVSQGVPMMSHGDEVGRTQQGNNNAYCQDGELTWVDWDLDDGELRLLEYVRRCLTVRQQHPVLRRRGFFHGHPVDDDSDGKDLTWLRPEGGEMQPGDWHDGSRRTVGMRLDGDAADYVDERGRPVQGATLLVLLHGDAGRCRFRLPEEPAPGRWVPLLDSGRIPARLPGDGTAHLPPISVSVLEWQPGS